MADIDFLSTASSSGQGDSGKKDDKKKRTSKDMQMHVPEALKKKEDIKPEKHGFMDGVKGMLGKKGEEESSGDLLHPHEAEVRVEPPKAKIPPKPQLNVPPPPKVTPPKPPPPPKVTPPKPPPQSPPPKPPPKKPTPPQAPKKEDKRSTLRVSLLGTEGGSHMTNLTIRAQMKTFIIVLILSVALDGLIYGGILFYKSRVIKNIQRIEEGVGDLDKQIAELEKSVAPAQDFQKIAILAETLLEKHVHWTNFLALLEKRVLTEVQLLNMTGVESGNVITNIIARDYTTLAKQILMFESDPRIIETVIAGASAAYGEEGLLTGVSTVLSIKFDPAMLEANTASVEDANTNETQ